MGYIILFSYIHLEYINFYLKGNVGNYGDLIRGVKSTVCILVYIYVGITWPCNEIGNIEREVGVLLRRRSQRA
jgi:hypothetical protein